jgi:hypothetical protein
MVYQWLSWVGKGENNVVEMAWDELTARVIAKMSDGYALQVGIVFPLPKCQAATLFR